MAAFSTHATTLAVLVAYQSSCRASPSPFSAWLSNRWWHTAHLFAAERRAGRLVAGGRLGGGGLGGGAALWLMQHCVATVDGGGSPRHLHHALLPGTAVRRRATDGACTSTAVFESSSVILRDTWRVLRSRAGYMALLVVFLPIGTGAASNYWSASIR